MTSQLGVSTWSFPWAVGVPNYPRPSKPLGLRELLAKAKELDVQVVQIADNFPLHERNAAELREIRTTADALGLILEVGTKGVEPAHLRKYLEIARMLDAKLIRTLTHSASGSPDIAQAAAWIREVVPQLEASGISLAVENYELHTAREFAWLVEKIDSPNVGICLDTVNSFGALEGSETVFEILAPYTLNFHVKDFGIKRIDYQMGFVVEGSPAGEGRLDIKDLLKRLATFHHQPNIILEQWPPYLGNIEDTVANEAVWARRSIAYLQTAMYEVAPKR